MKSYSHYLLPVASIFLPLLMLSACGGGGSSSSPVTASTSANAFASLQGKYATDCVPNPATLTTSESHTLTITRLRGSDTADFTFNAKQYSQLNCVDSTKTADVTLGGTLTSSGSTKAVSAQTAAVAPLKSGLNKVGTANIANIGIDSVTLSKWTGSFPTNVTAKVG